MPLPRTPYLPDQEKSKSSKFQRYDTPDPYVIKRLRAGYAWGISISRLVEETQLSRSAVSRIVRYKTYPEIVQGLKSLCLDKPVPDRINRTVKIQLYRNGGLRISWIAQILNLTERTIYRHLEG